MSYAIMRIQKIKSSNALAEREKHNTREKEVLSSDGSRNISIEGRRGLVRHIEKLEKDINSKSVKRTRKDAIRAIEILFTSDKAFFKKVDANQYFTECKKWLQEEFGEENLLQFCIHMDEETEHAHAILSTVKDGKFNYSGYVGGRQDLRALQDSFYNKVSYMGLERGQKVELTKATYQTNQAWHKNIEKARTEAQALSPENRLDYAVQGLMAKSEIENLNKNIMTLSLENLELDEKYRGLRRGALQASRDIKIVEQMEKWGIKQNAKEGQQNKTTSKEIEKELSR